MDAKCESGDNPIDIDSFIPVEEQDEIFKLEIIPCDTTENNINMNDNLIDNDKINSELEEEVERKHFQRIVNAFRSYKLHSLRRLYNSVKYINSLPEHQRHFLKSYRSHLDKVRVAIEHNYEIIKIVIKDAAHLFQNADHSNDIKVISSNVTQFDMEKVQSIFKQLYREWSVEGKTEREASFKPILDEIMLRFPPDKVDAANIKVLVPGAGLGRLPYEIAKSGYTCQGNEFSLFMLITSNFVLNKCQGLDLYKIYPWVHQYYNNLKSCDQIQMVRFPDVDPCELPSGLEFSMAAGSFIEIYGDPDKWDCIATCFFLDTANNVIDYIETTWNILKPGGYWVNLGPLLYHHADVPNENSIEPSYEEIRDIIVKFGFNILFGHHMDATGAEPPLTRGGGDNMCQPFVMKVQPDLPKDPRASVFPPSTCMCRTNRCKLSAQNNQSAAACNLTSLGC